MKSTSLLTLFLPILLTCSGKSEVNNESTSLSNSKEKSSILISRTKYKEQLYGFWLGQCIANWTGLITEMDKIGNIGEIKTGAFYTHKDWGMPDQPSIWSEGVPSELSPTIDFVLRDTNEVWGADDDTDIEYLYQHLHFVHNSSLLSPRQIRDGWLKHIKLEEENYLWVSNQKAFDLMKAGVMPPETGSPENNEYFDMIDAQLTTEIFGLFSPARPDIAMKIAQLPIQTTARKEAEDIAQFYVAMHSLASITDPLLPVKKRIKQIALRARQVLSEGSYPASMFDFVLKPYNNGLSWEQTRDSIYQRYQIDQRDGYKITSRNLYCNGCFAAGINFAASLVSLFYGEGDIKETIKIGTLAGWDSDNPTATWGGLIGFMIGKKGIEAAFNQKFSNRFDIHRTRQNFPGNGIDTFESMVEKGISVVDKVVTQQIGGKIDREKNTWIIPLMNEK